jgi:hypothetical protein
MLKRIIFWTVSPIVNVNNFHAYLDLDLFLDFHNNFIQFIFWPKGSYMFKTLRKPLI